MASRPIVSVIIPVYNAERYLARCLDSIIAQSLKGFEIIAVDDGSSDGSAEILRQYSARHGNLQIKTQVNQGISAARNAGIGDAMGKFVMFVDNDDTVNEDYLASFVSAIEDSNCEIIYGNGFNEIKDGKKTQKIYRKNPEWLFVPPWQKIYRREFLQEKAIKFPKTKLGEDIYFNVIALSKAQQIGRIDYTGYNHFYRQESASQAEKNSRVNPDDLPRVAAQIIDDIDYNFAVKHKSRLRRYLDKIVFFNWLNYGGKLVQVLAIRRKLKQRLELGGGQS